MYTYAIDLARAYASLTIDAILDQNSITGSETHEVCGGGSSHSCDGSKHEKNRLHFDKYFVSAEVMRKRSNRVITSERTRVIYLSRLSETMAMPLVSLHCPLPPRAFCSL